MALINCPECGKEFSDKADKCPNCGISTEYLALETQIKERRTKPCELSLSQDIDKFERLNKKFNRGWAREMGGFMGGSAVIAGLFIGLTVNPVMGMIAGSLIVILFLIFLNGPKGEMNAVLEKLQECYKGKYPTIQAQNINSSYEIIENNKKISSTLTEKFDGILDVEIYNYAYKIGADAISINSNYSSTDTSGRIQSSKKNVSGNIESVVSHHADVTFVKIK